MAEAVEAARLFTAIRQQGKECSRARCKFYAIRCDGNDGYFQRNCSSKTCELYAAGALPNLRLWEWYEELAIWQRAGLEALVNNVVAGLDANMITAFVLFSRALRGGDPR